MTGFEVTLGERSLWQRRAAARLASILDRHRDLPVIVWTVGSAGSVLVGKVIGGAGADVRAVFEVWRSALALGENREYRSGSGTVYLGASAERDRVRLRLSATVFDDDEGEG